MIQQFRQLDPPKSCTVLDIGTADGLVLRDFMEHCGLNRCIGMDIRFCYLKAAKENVPYVIQADGRRLPLCKNSVDIIISTAVFKHIRGLENLLKECHRVLRLGGKLIVTDPTPLGIHLGLLLGYFKRKNIIQILSLEDTKQMLIRSDFTVLRAERFMLSPIPFVGCDVLERVLKRAHLDQLFFDQIIFAES
jgi:ubiquinone/menaquinone biosynthesis C-methylase UbiE